MRPVLVSGRRFPPLGQGLVMTKVLGHEPMPTFGSTRVTYGMLSPCRPPEGVPPLMSRGWMAEMRGKQRLPRLPIPPILPPLRGLKSLLGDCSGASQELTVGPSHQSGPDSKYVGNDEVWIVSGGEGERIVIFHSAETAPP